MIFWEYKELTENFKMLPKQYCQSKNNMQSSIITNPTSPRQNSIALQTKQGRDIENTQYFHISPYDLHESQKLIRDYNQARLRHDASATYNCHGLTFASRRTWINETLQIIDILSDDNYVEINTKELLPGDIVIYYDSNYNEIYHSAIVIEEPTTINKLLVPLVYSKWGIGPEFIHSLYNSPYGCNTKFYRCKA